MDDAITAYLMDKNAVPELGPLPKVLERKHTILGANGIQVVQNADRTFTVVSMTEDARKLLSQVEEATTAASDPTEFAAFRVSFDGESTVTIKAGYINWVKWTGAAWSFREEKIDETTLDISAVGFPSTIMLKVPMKWNNSELVAGSPVETQVTGPFLIDGGYYQFTSVYTTDWSGVDEALFATDPHYEATVSPSTSSTTMFRMKLATITEAGNVEPINFSSVTLPQAFSARAVSLDIVQL